MSSIPHRAKFRTADSPFAASKHSCSGDSDRESNAFTDVAGGHFADLRVSRPRDLERRGKFIDNTCPVGSSASATSTSVSSRSKTSRSSAGPAARRSWCRLSLPLSMLEKCSNRGLVRPLKSSSSIGLKESQKKCLRSGVGIEAEDGSSMEFVLNA